ncbi:MAG: hypothetical protein WC307_05140 [Candidatus Nanoarchaeia archaeon]|jgi:hypothetical protein
MEIGTNKGKKIGKPGLTLTCVMQSKYNKDKRIKSASTTLHTGMSPRQVIEMFKKEFRE